VWTYEAIALLREGIVVGLRRGLIGGLFILAGTVLINDLLGT
jgi:hypothetical protein